MSTQDRPLSGRIALVTGGAGSLGRAICLALAQAGAEIVIHHLDTPDDADAVAAQVRAFDVRAHVVQADVTDESSVTACVAGIESTIGPVDILVNNAGYMDERPFLETTLAVWRKTIEVDLTGVFLVTHAVVTHMLPRGHGHIVNIASQLAFKGGPNLAPYSAAKAGVVGLTRALARELGPALHVSAIAPGPLETAMTAPYADEAWLKGKTTGMILGRLGQVDEVAPLVVLLASEAGALLAGQVLHPNGGGVMA